MRRKGLSRTLCFAVVLFSTSLVPLAASANQLHARFPLCDYCK